jgi:hypothetical protein
MVSVGEVSMVARLDLNGLAFICHVEVTESDHGVTNTNVDYMSFSLSHVVNRREVQPVVGELTIYDDGTVVYQPRAVGSATQTDVNAVADFVLMVVKYGNLSLKVW